jgi:hypothetical protein
VLEGDANIEYFHSCANGRRRKTKIYSLETEEGTVTNQPDICKHVVDFYKQLFRFVRHKGMQLDTGFWPLEETLRVADKEMLSSPFSEKDVVYVIMIMKAKSAPGSNGLTVTFFRKFWRYLEKKDFMQMVHDFNRNTLDLKRLNYGVITLVPKVKEANTVRQYMPI